MWKTIAVAGATAVIIGGAGTAALAASGTTTPPPVSLIEQLGIGQLGERVDDKRPHVRRRRPAPQGGARNLGDPEQEDQDVHDARRHSGSGHHITSSLRICGIT